MNTISLYNIKEALNVWMPEHSYNRHKSLVALCTARTRSGHLQFPAFLHRLQLSGIPTVDRKTPEARDAVSSHSDSCNEPLTTFTYISRTVIHSDMWWAVQATNCVRKHSHSLCFLLPLSVVDPVDFLSIYCTTALSWRIRLALSSFFNTVIVCLSISSFFFTEDIYL